MSIQNYFKDYNFLFDSHAHLSTGNFKDWEEVVNKAEKNGVEKIFDIGVDITSSMKAVEKARINPSVQAFVGVDPEIFEPGSEMFLGLDIKNLWFEDIQSKLANLIENNKDVVKGIGETGMDFYHDNILDAETRNLGRKLQEKLFRIHLELAKEFKLPLSIHSRLAEDECLKIVKNFSEVSGIFHSYTGDYKTAIKVLDAGWGLGVNGIVTFKNAESLREMYRKILGKEDKLQPNYFYSKGIFFETDSPYLAPEGKRGEVNEPANINYIYNSFITSL